jgi:hypothetical protein
MTKEQNTLTKNVVFRLPENFTEFSKDVMSNYDYVIDYNAAELVKSKPLYFRYTGWNFCGYVWWQNHKWYCDVWAYGSYCKTFDADKLENIMSDVSDEYGYD